MPTYTFGCTYCGHTHDVLRKIAERDAPELCPRCMETCYRKLAAPRGRVLGPAYAAKHRTADRYTADRLGIPLRELPKGLQSDFEED